MHAMAEQEAAIPRNTREFRNINAVKDLPNYRLPAAGVVSILHRVSGFVMAALLPLIVWALDSSLTSELSYEAFTGLFSAWYVKVVLLGLAWAFLHHLCAGVRHLMMDLHIGMTKEASKTSALAVFGVSIALTALIALKVFGVL
jgi:succinate dehydrogenase / fumarate reductase cytochrome b subunit